MTRFFMTCPPPSPSSRRAAPHRRVHRAQLACLLCLTVGALACDARGSTGTVSPTGHQGTDSNLVPRGSFEGESMNELALRLDKLVSTQGEVVAASNQTTDKCEETCELSHSICDVKTKMCDIADDRVADDEYQNLCRKAKQRCQEAAQSCIRCVEHHERASRGRSTDPAEPASCAGEPEPETKTKPEPEAKTPDEPPSP